MIYSCSSDTTSSENYLNNRKAHRASSTSQSSTHSNRCRGSLFQPLGVCVCTNLCFHNHNLALNCRPARLSNHLQCTLQCTYHMLAPMSRSPVLSCPFQQDKNYTLSSRQSCIFQLDNFCSRSPTCFRIRFDTFPLRSFCIRSSRFGPHTYLVDIGNNCFDQ